MAANSQNEPLGRIAADLGEGVHVQWDGHYLQIQAGERGRVSLKREAALALLRLLAREEGSIR